MADREKVIKGLDVCTSKPCYCTDCPYEANCCLDSQEVMEDALALLKEQEAVKPIWEQESMICGVCGHDVIWQKPLGDGFLGDEELNYCPYCGRKVKWE